MIRINLLSEEERGKKIRRARPGLKIPSLKFPMVSQAIWMVGVIIALVAIFLIGYAVPRVEIGNLSEEITRMENRLAKLRKEAQLVRDLEAKEKDLRGRLDIIQKLNRNRFLRVKVLDDLCSRVPDYIWLTSFEEVSSQLKITGLAFSNLTVAKFMKELSESNYFANPELISLKKRTIGGQDVMEFSLTSEMKGISLPEREPKRPRRGRG